jgi:hypothetical protein
MVVTKVSRSEWKEDVCQEAIKIKLRQLFTKLKALRLTIHSVLNVLGLAPTKPWRIIIKIDVKGVFVQMPMTGEPMYVKIDPKVTRFAVEMYLKLARYVESGACLYTLLLKALYGCVQASALWYALIKTELVEMGYEVGLTDLCVFIKQVGKHIAAKSKARNMIGYPAVRGEQQAVIPWYGDRYY